VRFAKEEGRFVENDGSMGDIRRTPADLADLADFGGQREGNFFNLRYASVNALLKVSLKCL
jgi:hypothetical protein